MKRMFIIYAVILLIILMGGCAEKEVTADIFAMDTLMSFTLYGKQEDMNEIKAEIYRLDNKFSSEKEQSIIYQMNHQEQTKLDGETLYLLQEAREMKERTGGAFDISLGALSRRWGFFNREYENENYTVPSDAEIDMLLDEHNSFSINGEVFVRKQAQIDLGACIKGYAGDRITEILKENGITGGVFSLGGNICTIGQRKDGKGWRIAVQDPQGGYLGTLESRDEAVVTSGAYQRYFEKDGVLYHHILDPCTGRPAQSGLASVTVVSSSGFTADMLSTAVFVMGRQKAEAFYQNNEGVELILQDEAGGLYVTQGLAARFTPEKDQEIHIIKRG